MYDKVKDKLEQYERDGDYPKLKRELLILFNVVGQSGQLKTVKQGETLILDNKLEVEVITPESSVLIKDSRDGMLRWVGKERLKRK